MHYDNQVFRPPQEAYTPLLQVTHGCSHGKCTFCNMYDRNPFALADKEEILADIDELAATNNPFKRIYLVNGDPFCLSRDKLLWIIEAIRKRIPTVETVSMYASVNNVARKSDEDLAILRKEGIADLYMGFESFSDEALKFANTGYTADEAVAQHKRLEAAGIRTSIGFMLGLLGKGRGIETGRINGEYMSKINPGEIWFMSTTVMPGTELMRRREAGTFTESSEYERVQEIRSFLEHVHMQKSTYFNSIHPTNAFRIRGYLPEDVERMKEECDGIIEGHTESSYQTLFDRQKLRSL